jgi:hypothetical protein
MTENEIPGLVGFGILAVLLNMLGVLCLGVGLFVTIPTTIFAMICLYDRLIKKTFPGQVADTELLNA